MKKIESPRRVGTAGTEKKSKILYVEDEVENWNVTQLRLGERYEMERAASDSEAVDRLRTNRDAYSAILMDIQLKGSQLDGVQLTQLLRGKLDPGLVPAWARDLLPVNTPIIFVTAYGAKYGEGTLQKAGGDMVIEKPVNFNKLTLAIANVSINKAMSALDSMSAKVRSS
jgi:CheY-like chemotaxis protein